MARFAIRQAVLHNTCILSVSLCCLSDLLGWWLGLLSGRLCYTTLAYYMYHCVVYLIFMAGGQVCYKAGCVTHHLHIICIIVLFT